MEREAEGREGNAQRRKVGRKKGNTMPFTNTNIQIFKYKNIQI
jgi:hypothetical protein